MRAIITEKDLVFHIKKNSEYLYVRGELILSIVRVLKISTMRLTIAIFLIISSVLIGIASLGFGANAMPLTAFLLLLSFLISGTSTLFSVLSIYLYGNNLNIIYKLKKYKIVEHNSDYLMLKKN